MKDLTVKPTLIAGTAICCAAFGISPADATGQATYSPGSVAGRADAEVFLAPPSQGEVPDGFWRVEEGMNLFYLSAGPDGWTGRWEDQGDAGAPVLFVHGGPGFPPHEIPEGLQRLAEKYPVYLYHQRGSGKSTRPFDRFPQASFPENAAALTGALGMAQQVADIERVRRLLGQERLTVIGHSFGGFIATLYAVEFPERVDRLILVSPAEMLSMPQSGGGLFGTIREALPEGAVRSEYDAYVQRYFSAFGMLFNMSEQELVALSREFARYYGMAVEAQGLATTGAPDGYDSGFMPFGVYFSLGMQYDHSAALSLIESPVLVLTGGRDFSTTEAGLAKYIDNIADATVVEIAEAGHFAFLDEPSEFAAVVRRFLDP
jgi:proline iminopeptidase